MFTDLEKTLTRDEIRKCIFYGNPSGEVENEKERAAHLALRNAYVEYIDAWNIYQSFSTDDNKNLMYQKKEKVKELASKYKDSFSDGEIMLAMKAAYIDVESRN